MHFEREFESRALSAGAKAEKASEVMPRANAHPSYEDIFHQMVDKVQEIFWMLDASTYEVIYVSPAFEKICGLPCQSLYDATT